MKKLLALAVGLSMVLCIANFALASDEGMIREDVQTRNIGANVQNAQGEDLGSITDIVYESPGGEPRFAVVSHTTADGQEKLTPVPFNLLRFRDSKIALLDISKDKFASAPGFQRGQEPDMAGRQWGEDTYYYFGITPPWQEETEPRDTMEPPTGLQSPPDVPEPGTEERDPMDMR